MTQVEEGAETSRQSHQRFWQSTRLRPGSFHHNLVRHPGRGVIWMNEPFANLEIHHNHIRCATTKTPRTEGLFGFNPASDFKTIRLTDNLIECEGTPRPLLRSAASAAAVIENNKITGISDTSRRGRSRPKTCRRRLEARADPRRTGNLETSFTKDELLTNIMLYWTTQSMPSATRIYYESQHNLPRPPSMTPFTNSSQSSPMGFALFPKEINVPPRAWVERVYGDQLIHWTEMPRGGHFAAMEQPGLLSQDIREFFDKVRQP